MHKWHPDERNPDAPETAAPDRGLLAGRPRRGWLDVGRRSHARIAARAMKHTATAPCNLCGVAWPNHVESCAYVHTARRAITLEASMKRVDALLQERRWWNDNVWAAAQIANDALNASLHAPSGRSR